MPSTPEAPPLAEITVTATLLSAGDAQYPCTIGRAGFVTEKVEGDGGTPRGRFPLRRAYYRPDRLDPPPTDLPLVSLHSLLGWCDDPASPWYNQKVTLPFLPSHEKLWRDDGCYDIVVVLGHNDDPVVPGKGSAIFLHLAHDDARPTAGCVALSRADMLALLPRLGPRTEIVLG